MVERLNICVLGLTITSSWGNGHATTYRALVRELCSRGHDVTFLERDVPWYAENRDLPRPPYGRAELYSTLAELEERFSRTVRTADLCIVGSYVPEGIQVGEWVTQTAEGVTAFYDIDTPVTLAKIDQGVCDYLSPDLMPRYDLYLSFTGGPTLKRLVEKYKSPLALPLYCSVDQAMYCPKSAVMKWDLGYMGTFSPDRQPALERLLIEPAIRLPGYHMVLAGPQYPTDIDWPANIERIEHLSPSEHCQFYNSQRFTVNVTRSDMVAAGYSPSVRLFEAAACGTPIISDYWAGLESFFDIGSEIVVTETVEETIRILCEMPEAERVAIGRRARTRVLSEHTSRHRAAQLEGYALGLLNCSRRMHG